MLAPFPTGIHQLVPVNASDGGGNPSSLIILCRGFRRDCLFNGIMCNGCEMLRASRVNDIILCDCRYEIEPGHQHQIAEDQDGSLEIV